MTRTRLALAATALALIGLAFAVSPPARASMAESFHLMPGATISLATPEFIVKGKRYAFSWPGGGPPQTFTVKEVRKDGWVLVEVAEENIDLNIVPLGTLPVRWLNVGIATSVQEMRPIIQ